MADPRSQNPQNRRANHSPLMKALSSRQSINDVINFCPFGCEDHELDEHGYCGHLIGFYSKGTSFEPRVRRKKDGRVIVDGTKPRPMEKGFVRVKITTSARVYSPHLVKDLVPRENNALTELREVENRERQIEEFAEQVRNPVLEGEWDDSVYNSPMAAAAIAPLNGPPK